MASNTRKFDSGILKALNRASKPLPSRERSKPGNTKLSTGHLKHSYAFRHITTVCSTLPGKFLASGCSKDSETTFLNLRRDKIPWIHYERMNRRVRTFFSQGLVSLLKNHALEEYSEDFRNHNFRFGGLKR